MAAEVVAGAFLTVSLEVLSGRIRSIMDFVRRNKVDARLLEELDTTLLSVKGVLNDAEKKQVSDSNVRKWIQKLNDAIHNAEDLVDEINTEALRCKIEGSQSQSSRTGAMLFTVRNFILSRLNVKDVEQRINNILNTLKYIVDQKQHLRLSEDVEPMTSSCATTLVKDSDIYGRGDDKQAIVSIEYCNQIQCLPQQGLPTTLTSLRLSSLPNLKSLNGDTFRHLTSLQKLTISFCGQFQCLPQERLPESLSKLEIYRCPLLKPRCERGIGEDWPYIRHIPRITIDYQRI